MSTIVPYKYVSYSRLEFLSTSQSKYFPISRECISAVVCRRRNRYKCVRLYEIFIREISIPSPYGGKFNIKDGWCDIRIRIIRKRRFGKGEDLSPGLAAIPGLKYIPREEIRAKSSGRIIFPEKLL